MNEKDFKKAINQLGRVRKSPALDQHDKKTIERIRKKLYNKCNDKKRISKKPPRFTNCTRSHKMD